MSFGFVLVIAIPILFVIGTTYNAIKEQKKLEDGILKNVLKKREEMKKINLKKQQKQKRKDGDEEWQSIIWKQRSSAVEPGAPLWRLPHI